MKVYYISSGLQGCYYVRSLLPLQANGWDGDQTSIFPENRTPEDKTLAAKDADIIVFHRPEHPQKLELARVLKQMGKKIVFDNDDTYKDDKCFKFNEFMNEERLKRGLGRINDVVDMFIKESDLITCSTGFLNEEYGKLNPNVVTLPNCVDPFMFDEPLRNETDVVRIGITGSIGVTTDLDIAMPIIKYYHKDPRVKIVLFSLPPDKQDKMTRELYAEEYKFLESVDVEWHTFVPMSEYFEKLNELRLDLMIIPRHDNYFNRCKSNLKFLEASMFEIPVIAQGFADGKSPYQVNPEDAKHLTIILDNKDWIPEIEKLINDKEKRLEIGKKAHEYVLKNYNIEDKAQKWVDAYKSIK
jgi:glycosyltransferase involved in cell wall biosynthesis